jgi:threonine/homoserine/homoserine lactone efflux protein
LNLLTIFFTAWVVGFSGAMMPGPLLTVTISESARRGAKAGPLLMIGHAILELVLVIALVAGLQKYLSNKAFVTVVSILGGVFLLWMGYGMVRDAWLGKVSLDLTVDGKRAVMGPVLAGILVSLSNPFWTIWWVTIGLNYITNAWVHGIAGLAFFFTGHILADFTWYGMVSLAVAKGKRFMNDRTFRIIIGCCGLFLIGLAGVFIKNGVV